MIERETDKTITELPPQEQFDLLHERVKEITLEKTEIIPPEMLKEIKEREV